MMHRMDTKLIDVFVSYSRTDLVRVESWVKRLRKGGVRIWFDVRGDGGRKGSKISAREAAKRCQVLIWFVSKFSKVSQGAGAAASEASTNGKTVLVVTLDTSPAPADFDASLPGMAAVDLLLLGRQATWEAILKAVRGQGVPWVPPGAKRKRSSRPNERRSTALARAWLRAAILTVLVLIGGSLAVTRIKHRQGETHPPLPVSSVPAGQPQRLLTVTTATTLPPPITLPERPAAAASRPPITLPERPAALTQQDLADPQTVKAIEHVKHCIEAAGRENGLSQTEIDQIAGYWADPTFIEGMGLQDANGIKASLTNRQRELPKWKEIVHFIKAVGTEKPTVFEVIAQTSFASTNSEHVESRGTVLAHYWVDVSVLEQPKITKLWVENKREL